MLKELDLLMQTEQQINIIRFSIKRLKQQIRTESDKYRLIELNNLLNTEEYKLDELVIKFPEVNI
jgi:hypothetical protein